MAGYGNDLPTPGTRIPPGTPVGLRRPLQSIQQQVSRITLATTARPGLVQQAVSVPDLAMSVNDPPTQSDVQAIADTVDALLSALRDAGILHS